MKSVLVTGGNRTGTSWVGKMLCFAEELFFVWEPFNCMFPAPFTKHPLKRHYRRLLPEESAKMKRYVRRKTFSELVNSIEGGKGVLPKLKKLSSVFADTTDYLFERKAPLFKDPTALMAAEWFENHYQSRVVLTVRHPGAYVNSIKRLGWPMCVEEFANQPWLMETLPESLQVEIHERIALRKRPKSYILEDAALCWKVFHAVVHQYRTDHNDWLLVRHEDLSADYVSGFRELYTKLDLRWTEDIEKKIDFHCSPSNNVVLGHSNYQTRQDSASLSQLWKKDLSSEEITIIRNITGSVAELFYDDASWN